MATFLAATIGFGYASALTGYGGGSVQGYAATQTLNDGTIVILENAKSQTVAPASQSDLQNMFGVVVDPQQVPIKYSSADLQNETYVAVSGTYNVLVSTQGGDIAAGDYVTLSSLDGVAMKAGTTQSTVFGRAAGAFSSKSASLGTTTLKDSAGATKSVSLGVVPVTIDIRHNPNRKTTKVNAPKFLEKIGQEIAQKTVSPIRIYISLAITAASIIIALVLLYAGVRNAIIAIGRNPMSKKSIFRALAEVVLTSILVLIIGLFAVYLLLKL